MIAKHELNNHRHAKADMKKPMRSQSYTKSCGQEGDTNWFIQCPMASSENIQVTSYCLNRL